MMVAAGVSGVVMSFLLSFAFFTNRSFTSLTNYLDLDQKTEAALDKMSQQIRQVNSLSAYTSNSLTFVDYDGATLQYTYNSDSQTLRRTKSGVTDTLLTGCTSLQFSIFQRTPCSNTFLPYSTATVTNTKIIELTWNCSRKIFGRSANNESMQSARVVIRKK
jgi:predicted nucleotidyltransferase